MQLNTLKPAPGSHRPAKRVGRGAGSGAGSTAGRGTKGQRSRSGSGPKAGFEGGQMPLQRRLPKFGFSSRKGRFVAEVRLGSLGKCEGEVVDLESLRKAGLIARYVRRVKIIASGSVERAFTIRALGVTKGARAAIEQAGGHIEEAAG